MSDDRKPPMPPTDWTCEPITLTQEELRDIEKNIKFFVPMESSEPVERECFLCDKIHDGIHGPHIEKLSLIMNECYGKYSNEELAQRIHLYFKENVYNPESGMAMLEKEDVLEHIESHHNQNEDV